jgi:hypothetical protein
MGTWGYTSLISEKMLSHRGLGSISVREASLKRIHNATAMFAMVNFGSTTPVGKGSNDSR